LPANLNYFLLKRYIFKFKKQFKKLYYTSRALYFPVLNSQDLTLILDYYKKLILFVSQMCYSGGIMKIKVMLSLLCLFFFSSNVFPQEENPIKLVGKYFSLEEPGNKAKIILPDILSTNEEELNSVFSHDGKEFYFSRHKKPRGTGIMVMFLKDGIWTSPKLASFSNGDSDVDPALSPDGNKIFFGSVRSESLGQADIYMVTRTGVNSWSIPQHLGPVINTVRNENHPSVAEDGTLYFHSTGHGGFGESDIYKSEYIDGKYTKPENLGKAINSEYGDFDAFISPDEDYIIFSSNGRPDSFGKGDLYISFALKDCN